MATKDKFLFSKDKHQTFTNNVSFSDKNGRYSNLNINKNQNCPILIPVQYSNNPKNDKDGVSDKYDKWEKSEAWNRSVDLCFHTLTLNDKDEEGTKKKWKKDVLSEFISTPLFLHISAYESSKEITGFDTIDDGNVGFKRNKIIMEKQDFLRLIIQNPFEFPRQQEENRAIKPELMGFKARYSLLGSGKPTPSNTNRITNPVADSSVRYFNQEYPRTPNVQPSLVSPQMLQQQFHGHPSDLGSSVY
uniref:Uncharacterized protein n=1 Tax=Panagrolaimus sp. PS1159 TaxID=55785 RepID=A0AC35GSX2_9BILA